MPKTLHRNKALTTRRNAVTPREWRELCERALERAKKKGDRRSGGLEKALATRREEPTLRALGIICDLDLDRVFSDPPT
jgi:hypothetical protein